MSLSLILAAIWALTANILAMIPSRDNHWALAYVLMALAVPMLVYVAYENGPWWGLAVLLAVLSVLRWPVLYFGRWVFRRLR